VGLVRPPRKTPKNRKKKKVAEIAEEQFRFEHPVPQPVTGNVHNIGGDVYRQVSGFLDHEDQLHLRAASQILSKQRCFEQKIRPGFFRELVIKHGWDLTRWPDADRRGVNNLSEKVFSLNLVGLDLDRKKIELVRRLFPNLTKLDLTGVEFSNDQAVEELRHFSHLETLVLERSNIEVLPDFGEMPLQHLDISRCALLPYGTIDALPHIPTLKVLRAALTHVTVLDFWHRNPQLEEVDLSQCFRIQQAAFDELPEEGLELKRLNLGRLEVTSLDFLQKLREIQSLSLESCGRLSAEEFRNFPHIPTLKEVDLALTHIASLELFERNPQLEKANLLQCTDLSREILDMFPQTASLRSLNLASSHLRSFALLERNPQIEEFDCSFCIDIPGDAVFPPMRHLKKLYMKGLHLIRLDHIGECAELEVFDIERCQAFIVDSIEFKKLKKLKEVNLAQLGWMTSQMVQLTFHLETIERLNIEGSPLIRLAELPYMPKLKSFELTPYVDYDRVISKQKNVEELILQNRDIRVDPSFLKDLPKLKRVDMPQPLTHKPKLRKDNRIKEWRAPLFNFDEGYLPSIETMPRLERLCVEDRNNPIQSVR